MFLMKQPLFWSPHGTSVRGWPNSKWEPMDVKDTRAEHLRCREVLALTRNRVCLRIYVEVMCTKNKYAVGIGKSNIIVTIIIMHALMQFNLIHVTHLWSEHTVLNWYRYALCIFFITAYTYKHFIEDHWTLLKHMTQHVTFTQREIMYHSLLFYVCGIL